MGRAIALDIARGLTFLHSNNIAHMDLKTPNGALPMHALCAALRCAASANGSCQDAELHPLRMLIFSACD